MHSSIKRLSIPSLSRLPHFISYPHSLKAVSFHSHFSSNLLYLFLNISVLPFPLPPSFFYISSCPPFLQFNGTGICERLQPLWVCFLSTSSPTMKTNKTSCLSVMSHKPPLQYLICVFKSFLCSYMCLVCVYVLFSGVYVFLVTSLQKLSCPDITLLWPHFDMSSVCVCVCVWVCRWSMRLTPGLLRNL